MNDLDLDAYNYAKKIQGKDDESVLYIHSELIDDKDHVTSFISGDVDMQVTGLITLMETVEGAFELFLDSVQQYAEEQNINIETYWDNLIETEHE